MPSNVVDDRIVKVEFDNEGFEEGVAESLNSLERFEKSLDSLEKSSFGEGVSNGFSDIQDSINDTDFSPISDALNNVGHGFSILEEIAIGALREVGSKVADLGLQMASSLTIDPIAEGFQKYTSSSKDVKAIMNQTGMGIEDVTEKLEALTWYSDATSYNYSAMVSALKSFSAQGIDVEDSIPMIMGLGNSLSYAGLAAEEASGAFDIYSKAIGRGYMDLRQWQRLNNMGASTVDLKEKYMEAAVAAGTLKKSADGTYKTLSGLEVSISTFDSTLGDQKGKWLTTDVMMSVLKDTYGVYTNELYNFSLAEENAGKSVVQLMDEYDAQAGSLNKYSRQTFLAAQEARTFAEAINAVADAASSGWKTVFENIFGNAEESTDLWTDFSELVYNVFMGPLEGLTRITTAWKELGGRTDFIQGFYNLVGSMTTITDPIKNGFGLIFRNFEGNLTDRLVELSTKFKDWTWNLQLNNEEQNKLGLAAYHVAKALRDVLNVVNKIVGYAKETLKALSPLLSIVGELTRSILTIGKTIKNAFKGIDISESAYSISDAIKTLNKYTKKLADFINKNIKKATEKIVAFIEAFREKGGVEKINKWINDFRESLSKLIRGDGEQSVGLLSKIADGFDKVKTAVSNGIDKAIEFITNAFVKLEPPVTKAWDALNNFIAIIKEGLGRYINPVIEELDKFVTKFKEAGKALIEGFSSGFNGKIDDFIKDVKEFVNKILKTAKDLLGIHSPSEEWWLLGKFSLQGFANGIKENVELVITAVNTLIGAVLEAIVESLPEFEKNVETLVNGIAEFLGTVSGVLFTALGLLITDLAGHISSFSTVFFDAGSTLISNVASGLGTASDSVVKSISGLIVRILNSFTENSGDVIGAGRGLLMAWTEGFGSEQPTAAGRIAEILGKLLSGAAKVFIDISDDLFDFTATIINGITEGTPKVLNALGEMIHQIAEFMNGGAKDDLLSIIDGVGEIILAYALASLPLMMTKFGEGVITLLGKSKGKSGLFGLFGTDKGWTGLVGLTEALNTGITSVFKALSTSMTNLTKSSPANTIKAIGLALIELAVSLLIISRIDDTKISQVLTTLGESLAGVLVSVGLMGKTIKTGEASVVATLVNALAGAFNQIAIGLAAFAIAAKLLDGVDSGIDKAMTILDKMVLFIGALTSVGVFATVSASMKGAGKDGTSNLASMIDGIFKAFTKIALSLVVFAAAARLMDGVDLDYIGAALLELVLTMGALSLASKFLDTTQLVSIAKAMTIVSLALIIFSGSARLMDGVNLDYVGAALLELVLTIGALGAISKLLDTSNIISVAKSMAILGVALIAIGAAGKIIETVNPEALKTMAIILAAIVGAVLILSALSGVIQPGILVLSQLAGAIMKLSLAGLLAAIAINLFIVGLGTLAVLTAAEIDAVVAALDLLLVGLVSLSEPLKNLIIMLIEIVCESIVGSIEAILKALGELLGAILPFLDEWIPKIFHSIFLWVGSFIIDLIETVAKGIVALAEACIQTFNLVWPDFLDAVRQGLNDLVVTFFMVLLDFKKALYEYITDSIFEFAAFLRTLGDAIDALINAIDYLVNDVILAKIGPLIRKFITSAFNTLCEAILGTVGDIINAMFDLIVDVATQIPIKLSEAWNKVKEAWTTAFSGAVTKDSDKVAKDAVTEIGNKLTTNSWRLDTAAKNLWNRIKGTFTKEADISSPSGEMAKIGDFLDQGLAEGIERSEDLPLDAITDLANSVTARSNFEEIDLPLVGDIDLDLDWNNINYKSQVAKAFRDHWEESIGKSASDGLGTALENAEVSDVSFKSLKETLSGLLSDNLGLADEDVTITPVLDLSQIEKGAGGIQELLGGVGSSLGITGVLDNVNLGDKVSQLGTTVNFTQNNYSPKELSRIDIYRQTKNQLSQRFSTAKGVV